MPVSDGMTTRKSTVCHPYGVPLRVHDCKPKEKVWIRKYLFGFRVQVGDPGKETLTADYCCGTEQYVIGLVSMMVQLALRRSVHGKDLPRQVVKPIWNDQVCFQQLAFLAGCTKEEVAAFFASYPPDRHDARVI